MNLLFKNRIFLHSDIVKIERVDGNVTYYETKRHFSSFLLVTLNLAAFIGKRVTGDYRNLMESLVTNKDHSPFNKNLN